MKKQRELTEEEAAAALEEIASKPGFLTLRESAQVLKMKQKSLVWMLIDRDWIERDSAGRLRIGSMIEPGLMGEKRGHPHLTPKGLVRVSMILSGAVA